MAFGGYGSKLLAQLVLAILLFVMLQGGVEAVTLCKIDTKDLDVCRPAVNSVNGQPLPMPTTACCDLVRSADLGCLCNLKAFLPTFGINTVNAMTLPSKCGVETPSQCHTP